MVEIKTHKYITTHDVEELTGKNWHHFKFAEECLNDSYQPLGCSDEDLHWLKEDLAYELENFGEMVEDDDFGDYELFRRHRVSSAQKLRNEIELINILRKDYGITDSILVWVSW